MCDETQIEVYSADSNEASYNMKLKLVFGMHGMHISENETVLRMLLVLRVRGCVYMCMCVLLSQESLHLSRVPVLIKEGLWSEEQKK